MTGVRERRFAEPGMRPSDVGIRAGRALLERVGPEVHKRVGALVYSAVCRAFVEPATASVVHHGLELPEACISFDVSNACLGFLNAMTLVGNMIEQGQIAAGVIVSGEDGRELVESTLAALLADETLTRKSIKPHFASLTIGSAGVAALLVHESLASEPHRRKLLGGVVRTDSRHHKLCQGDSTAPGTTLMQTDSEALLEAGVDLAGRTWAEMCEAFGWREPAAAVDKVVGHQVGRQHRRALFERLGLDVAKEYATFEHLGNVGSAAAPVTLAMAEEANFFAAGETVALMGIGSGLHCQMLALEW